MLFVWALVMVFIIARTPSDVNSRTVHLEEFVEGFDSGQPQGYWGLIWPVKVDGLHATEFTTYPVAADTCFVYNEDQKESTGKQSVMKNKYELCGPNVWHTHASCPTHKASDADQDVLFQQYFSYMGWTWPRTDEKEKKYWYSRPDDKYLREQCLNNKILPVRSFATDSRSYSLLANGNADVYMLTVWLILGLAAAANGALWVKQYRKEGLDDYFAARGNNSVSLVQDYGIATSIVQYAFFFAGYVVFFWIWNRNAVRSGMKSDEFQIANTNKEYWYVDDSCYGAVLVGWLAFSMFGWLTSNPSVIFVEPVDMPTVGSASPADEAAQLVMGADVMFKMEPVVTAEMEDTERLNPKHDPNLHNTIAESYMFALTFMFVLPFLLLTAMASSKFVVDIVLQKHLIGSVVVGILLYLLVMFSWSFQLIQAQPKDGEMYIKYVRWVCWVVMIIGSGVYGYLSYVFVWNVPHRSTGLVMIVLGGAGVLLFVILMEVVAQCGQGVYKYTPFWYQFARGYVMVCAFVMYMNSGTGMAVFDGLKGHMLSSGTSTTNSKELIWNYWVSGRNFRDPVDVLSYSIVHTPAPMVTTPAPAT